jgi:hypothetical protein
VSAAPTAARREALHRRGFWLEWFTVAWNVVEAVVAIGVGLAVGSVALVGFGVDSGIEVISAVALLWRLYRTGPNASAEEHGDAERKHCTWWPLPFPPGRRLSLPGWQQHP